MSKLNHLFTPYKIGNCEIPNRLVVPAMVANMCPDEGKASEQYIRYHEEKAKGGWGLIITEDYRVNANAGGYPHISALYDESQIESHRRLTDTIHQYETKIFAQIYHAGRQANHFVNGCVQPVSCSPIPDAWNKEIPRELTVAEIKQIVKDFGNCAKNVKRAGFDGVEIHGAHGYLIHQFLSPNSNKRIDEYGGTYENRTRFLREIMEEIRAQVGSEFPMTVRFSAVEGVPGGRTLFESHRMICDIEAWGADAIHISQGMYGARSSRGIVGSFFQDQGWTAENAAEAKKLVKVPIITVGSYKDPWMADEAIRLGMADFVAMGRGSLTDPHLPNKAKAGDFNDIRQCIGCLQGCTASTYQGVPLYCLVNPELGHEFEYDYTPVAKPKKIFVAGGGVGGMEAARAAKMKGHEVCLFEASGSLGGQFVTASYPPGKGEFATYPAWLYRELKKLHVEVRLNTPLTADIVRAEKPDKVIIATGGVPLKPEVPGIDGGNVVFAEDVLCGKSDCGMDVLIVGGGMTGSETSAFLGGMCKNTVAIIEKRRAVGMDMEAGIRDDLKEVMRYGYVDVMVNTSLKEVRNDGAVIETEGHERFYPCDTVILAIGAKAGGKLEAELEGLCETVVVGDAKDARKAIEASREGFDAGFFA